jgi:SPP1 gp7 family putative phage head morphogenesis protein
VARIRLEPVQFVEAIRVAGNAQVVLPQVYYGAVPAKARAGAFTVSGLAGIDQIEAIFASLQRVLTDGGAFETWRGEVLANPGMLGLPRHRLETIYRTNIQGWWNRGRAEQIIANLATHPFLLYSAVNDSRTRPEHARMHGTILRATDPWWQTHYPPNGFGCRCRAIALTEREAQRRGTTTIPTAADPDRGWNHSALQPNGEFAGLTAAIAAAAAAAEQRARDRVAAPIAAAALQLAREMRDRLRDPQAYSAGLRELLGDESYREARQAVERAALARNLPIDAAVALRAYTGNRHYTQFNRILRYIGSPEVLDVGVSNPDRYLPMIDGVLAAFAGLPRAPGTVFRGLSSDGLPADFVSRHQRGALVRYHATTSTSQSKGQSFPGDVLLVIRQRSGALIRDISFSPSEAEVLLPPGATFVVTRRQSIAGGWKIWLMEVDSTRVPLSERVYDFSHE